MTSSRRRFLQHASLALGGATIGSPQAVSAEPSGSIEQPADFPAWQLERPKPALPNSFFWTWDHSTNWVWDDPGVLNFGCFNQYLKRPETFVGDYRRLVDLAAGLGVRGITLWGFLRDSHGGVAAAKQVCEYARARGVDVMPGVGTSWYGGVFYQGDHQFNLETFLHAHPELAMILEDGQPHVDPRGAHGLCLNRGEAVAWLQEGVEWLLEEFAVGGANLENGDFLVCHCEHCRAQKARWPAADPDFLRQQGFSYAPAIESFQKCLPDGLTVAATYCGFNPHEMRCERPAMIDTLPAGAILQWTLSRMVLPQPLPLTAFLDDGAPESVYENPNWPKGLRPPNRRSVGFLHYGSQWSPWFLGAGPPETRPGTRYSTIVSSIKEACLRAHQAGLEGVSIHGEVDARHIPSALNYLAFSHFIHYPEDNLRDFGRKTLGQVLGSEEEGATFAEALAHWDAKTLSDAMRQDVQRRALELRNSVMLDGVDLQRYRFWSWLMAVSSGCDDPHTASLY